MLPLPPGEPAFRVLARSNWSVMQGAQPRSTRGSSSSRGSSSGGGGAKRTSPSGRRGKDVAYRGGRGPSHADEARMSQADDDAASFPDSDAGLMRGYLGVDDAKFWFVLSQNRLSYFEDADADTPLGTLPVDAVRSVRASKLNPREYAMRISTADVAFHRELSTSRGAPPPPPPRNSSARNSFGAQFCFTHPLPSIPQIARRRSRAPPPSPPSAARRSPPPPPSPSSPARTRRCPIPATPAAAAEAAVAAARRCGPGWAGGFRAATSGGATAGARPLT